MSEVEPRPGGQASRSPWTLPLVAQAFEPVPETAWNTNQSATMNPAELHPLDRPEGMAPPRSAEKSASRPKFGLRQLLQFSLNTLLLLMILAAVLFGLLQNRLRHGDALPVRVSGSTTTNWPVTYRFKAAGPGLLTLGLRAKNGQDLAIDVSSEGLTVPHGQINANFDGDPGAEQGTIALPSAGDYLVTVMPTSQNSRGIEFELVSSFLPFAGATGPASLKISEAKELVLGVKQPAAIERGAQGVILKYLPKANAIVTVSTGNSTSDIVLWAYEKEIRRGKELQRSDRDMLGNAGNEAITLNMVAGKTYYFLVTPYSGRPAVQFEIAAQAGGAMIASAVVPRTTTRLPTGSFPTPAMIAKVQPVVPGTAKAGRITATVNFELYSFVADRAGPVAVRTVNATGDTVLSVFDGQTRGLIQRSDQDLAGDRGAERIDFTAQKGTLYYILVEPFSSSWTPGFDVRVDWGTPTSLPGAAPPRVTPSFRPPLSDQPPFQSPSFNPPSFNPGNRSGNAPASEGQRVPLP